MSIKKIWIILIILILSISLGYGKEKRTMDITSLSINFNKTDAIFTVNYDIGKFARFYILIFGSRGLESDIDSIFSNFNHEIIRMDDHRAVLKVKNMTRFEKGYYLYDSNAKFGQGIKELDIYLPGSSEPKIYQNIYLFNWDNVPGTDDYNLINFLRQDIGINLDSDLKIYKELGNKSIIGVKGNISKEKVFEITLDKNNMQSFLKTNEGNYNLNLNLQVVETDGRFYIYSPYIYSIPNLFYRD